MGRKRSKSMRGIAWVKNIWRGRQLDMDLDDELRAYVAQLTDDYRAHGYEPEEALRAARIEAGAIESIKDQVRDARSGASIETLWQDVRFGVRLLRRSPSFMGAAVVSLALGIGANSAVFGLLNALLLRSLPFPARRSSPRSVSTARAAAGTPGATSSCPCLCGTGSAPSSRRSPS